MADRLALSVGLRTDGSGCENVLQTELHAEADRGLVHIFVWISKEMDQASSGRTAPHSAAYADVSDSI